MTTHSLININKLSPREKEVALHIANGVSTSTIAKTLGIKCNTVSTLKKKIYIKLGVDSSVALYKVLQGGNKHQYYFLKLIDASMLLFC